MPERPSKKKAAERTKTLTPRTPGKKKTQPNPKGHSGHLGHSRGENAGVIREVFDFLNQYIVLPEEYLLTASSWCVAAWINDKWDRFPHLAVTSPDRRCGKSRLLELLRWCTPNAHFTTNISAAALYRLVESMTPTLLLDEAQSIRRRHSEMSEVLRELLNAGIDRNSKVLRVGGANHDEVCEFGIYSPKVIALIGELDGVLADRCLPVDMKRKTAQDTVQPYRSRIVEPEGEKLLESLGKWRDKHADGVAKIYDEIDVFESMTNDRLAELLLPLQAVVKVDSPDDMPLLKKYAEILEARDKETVSPGVQLLASCKQIFENDKQVKDKEFIGTTTLIMKLVAREEEPWRHWSKGHEITPHALMHLLKPFGIRPEQSGDKKRRGYYKAHFQEPWKRYLP